MIILLIIIFSILIWFLLIVGAGMCIGDKGEPFNISRNKEHELIEEIIKDHPEYENVTFN